jgi:hypothetical protein
LVRLNLESDEIRARAVEREDPGYIDVPPKLFGYDIIAEKTKINQPIPPSMSNYVKDHNFYYVSLILSAGTDHKAQGAKWVTVKGKLFDENANELLAEDRGPKTEWIAGNKQLDMNVTVNLAAVSKPLELVNIPNPIEGTVTWKWHRHPHVRKVIAEGAGHKIGWTFYGTENGNEYIDGAHEAFFILRTPKGVKAPNLEVYDAKAEYDYKHKRDVLYYKGRPIKLPIETP